MKELPLKLYIGKRGRKVFIDILLVAICYLIGNISSSILIGRIAAGIDIRDHGSGNAGTTNVLRTIGKKAAVATLAGDVLKGVLAVLLGRFFGGEYLAMLCGLAAFIGHIWPAVFEFRGGKGIATGMGAVIVLAPELAGICILTGLVIIIFTRYVSLGAIIGGIALPIAAFFYSPEYFIWGLVVAIIAIIKHRANIQRLLKGTESKINFNK